MTREMTQAEWLFVLSAYEAGKLPTFTRETLNAIYWRQRLRASELRAVKAAYAQMALKAAT